MKKYEQLNESMYCGICNLHESCEKDKKCSCDDFVTDARIKTDKEKRP